MYQREMVLYTRNRSLRCWRAKRLLGRAGYRFEVVDVTADPEALAGLPAVARHGGDLGTVRALVGSGHFERLLRGDL